MVYKREFDSWLEFVQLSEYVNQKAEQGYFNGMKCASMYSHKNGWSGTATLDEAIKLAYEGWPEGLARLERLRDQLSIDHFLSRSHRINEYWDVTGDEPDIDRFLAHEPENMSTLQEVTLRHAGKLIKISVNRSASSRVSTERITRRGLALLIAIETVIKLGYSLELSLVMALRSVDNSGDHFELRIPILHAGDPLSMDSFAFLLMHPAVLRRLIFAITESEPRVIRKKFGFQSDKGYGYPAEPVFLPEGDLLMNWDEGLVDSDEHVMPFALSILKRVGIDTSRVE
jgi:hypothetical protein